MDFRYVQEKIYKILMDGWIWLWEVGSWVVERKVLRMNFRILVLLRSWVNGGIFY